MRTAVKMKRAGYRKGFPDMFICEPRGQYHGLFVEIKIKTRPSQDQLWWQAELLNRGYLALIMPSKLSFREAQDWLEEKTLDYISLPSSRLSSSSA